MPSRSKRVFFDDLLFTVDENVYEPAEDSFLFAENLDAKVGERVLDMGSGSGILGVIAARNANVVAIDVNPYAIRCTKKNAEINNLRSKMTFIQGDLFTPLNETAKFNVILFNAPYLPANEHEADSWIERAWTGGTAGRKIIDRFIPEAPKHLTPTGYVLLMQSAFASINETVIKFKESGLKANVIADASLPFFEKITLIKAENS